jgi:hypothetical protein
MWWNMQTTRVYTALSAQHNVRHCREFMLMLNPPPSCNRWNYAPLDFDWNLDTRSNLHAYAELQAVGVFRCDAPVFCRPPKVSEADHPGRCNFSARTKRGVR